ncbi:S41 family peptidase [Litorimonas sp. WD9-15]|uniref:S41 family peptidase n=1 Tax=Litorimonas sp. WD9-15 TaxID=3418716 RepID=UPI003CFF2792
MTHNLKTILAAGAALTLLAACGGGGGSNTPTTIITPPPVSEGPTFEAGKFDPASDFIDQCENPRAGTSDRAGSTLLEKFWLRSWTDETYLWYDEVTDLDPASIADRLDYFAELRTFATTASGKPKDEFHFSIDTETYEADRAGEASAGYGATFRLLRTSPPRDIRIAYTQDNGPAGEEGGFLRGDKILEVDGIDAVNGANTQADLDILNEAIFPTRVGDTHIFVVEDTNGTQRTVTLETADVVELPVTDTAVIDTESGKVGYIHFTTFSPFTSEKAIYDAMIEMEDEDISDLVLDLRYNGGGLLAVAAQTGFMIAGDAATDGRTFDRLTFSDKNPTINPVTGQTLRPTPFFGTGLDFSLDEDVDLPELDLDRVFILSTERTCSASEAVINGLRGIDVEVILIGSKTCGKPYGFYPTDNCGETYFTVQFRGANDKGFGDYADGFEPEGTSAFGVQTPGCNIEDDFIGQLGAEDETLLSAALQFREDGTCPSPDVSVAQSKTQTPDIFIDSPADMLSDDRVRDLERLRTLRIEVE